jgi:hypothetical protein
LRMFEDRVLRRIFSPKRKEVTSKFNIVACISPLLGNDREIRNYTMGVIRQRPVNSNRGTVFSVRAMLRCYKQDELVGELDLVYTCRVFGRDTRYASRPTSYPDRVKRLHAYESCSRSVHL